MRKLTVLNPAVAEAVVPLSAAPALPRIEGARIGFVDNSKQNADLFLGHVKPLLQRHGAQPGATVRKLARHLCKRHRKPQKKFGVGEMS